MKYKFIYCTDEKLKDELMNELPFLVEIMLNNKKTWVFENDNKVNFNNKELDKIQYTNKFYI